MAAIRFSFSLRGLAPAVTEEELTGFFASLGAAVVSVRMVPGGAYVNVSAGEPAKVSTTGGSVGPVRMIAHGPSSLRVCGCSHVRAHACAPVGSPASARAATPGEARHAASRASR